MYDGGVHYARNGSVRLARRVLGKGDLIFALFDGPTRAVRDLSAGSGLHFDSLGPQALKGLAEEIEVFRVTTPVHS